MDRIFSPRTEHSVQVKAALLALLLTAPALLIGILVNGRYNGDFAQFYVQGAVGLQHNAGLLYDIPAQTAFGHKLVPESSDFLLVPITSPQTSVLFSAFAKMTYLHAMLVWGLITYAGYAVCCYLLWRACPSLRPHLAGVAFAAAAFPGLSTLVLSGHTTIIALAAFTWAFYCLRDNRLFAAGLAIGMLAYKPQLGLVAAGMFVLTRTWRVVAGALVTGLGQYALACWWYKKLIVLDFLGALFRLQHVSTRLYEPSEYLMHSLRPLWRILLPSHLALPLYLATATIVFLCCLHIWKSASPLPLRFSAFLLATVLVDPHVYIYDLVLLAPALMLTADCRLEVRAEHNRVFAVLLGLVYSSPMVVRIFQHSRVAPILALFSIAGTAAFFGFLYFQSTSERAKVCCPPPLLSGADPNGAPSSFHGRGVSNC